MFKEVVEDIRLKLSRKKRRWHKTKLSKIKVDMKLSRKKGKKRHEIIEVREINKTWIHIQQIKTEKFEFISNKQK